MENKNLKDEKFTTKLNDLGRMDRRTFVKMAGVAAGAIAFGGSFLRNIPSAAAAPLPGGTLDPLTIPKYVMPLTIPSVMPTSPNPDPTFTGRYYEIAVRQFTQQILPAGMPATTVWSYGSVNHPGTFSYPSRTIEAASGTPVRVKWINDLKDSITGNFLPHILPVDQTLHWANPPGPRDMHGMDPAPYTGPVPVVVHLHGGHTTEENDGFPEAWFLPAANNIPAGYFTEGTKYAEFKAKFEAAHPNALWAPGTAVFEYDNASPQRAATLWFHDHTLGMTRNNVYAGPAGFYLIRGGPSDVRSGGRGGLPGGNYEIPLLIQDRSFNADGSLFFPNSREFFDGYAGPYVGDPNFPSDISPIWNPEFFGNTIVVNGNTWPYLNVEPRKYRFRILNGSDSRFLILKFGDGNVKTNFTVIGTDGGFLPAPVAVGQLLIGPAERFDVIVDFSRFRPGDRLHLLNLGPDSPFGGPFPAAAAADANTTGQVMQLRVVPLTAPDRSAIPPLPAFTPVGAETNVRQVSLNELESAQICVDRGNVYVPGATPPACTRRSVPLAPLEAELGTVDPVTGLGVPLEWVAQITENPALNSVEVWEIYNFTADAHPIHIHEVMFNVVNRQVIGGAARTPEVWESGDKDTVVAYPGEITRVRAKYDRAGLFVWHCHILSHEDNEMMRPYRIGP